MDVSKVRGDPYAQDYGTVEDLCDRLHALVDRVATLHKPSLLWALVVMAEDMLGESPRQRYAWAWFAALAWCVFVV